MYATAKMAEQPLRRREESDWYERLAALADRYEPELRRPPWYTIKQYHANYKFCNSKIWVNTVGVAWALMIMVLAALCLTLNLLPDIRERTIAVGILAPVGGLALLTLIILWCRYRHWKLADALHTFMYSYAPYIWILLRRAGAFARDEDRRELNAIMHLYFWNLTLQEINDWYKYVQLRYNYPIAVDHILIRQYV
jgi:hypothetical protein